jgi:tetratricopeptide (TPR) repeat protein
MGNMLNAMPFREQGLEISRIIDIDKDGRYLFQSEFNLGTAYINLGRLNYAMSYFERAIDIGNKLEDPELTSRVKAYRALIRYLQGSLKGADSEFTQAYKSMGNNPRAKGVFYCYHGELLIKLNQLNDAKTMILQSRQLGESHYYPDMVGYARLALGNILMREGDFDKAQTEFSESLIMARDKKIRRLESGALSAMSRLSHLLNDSEAARQRAVEGLKIANEYSLCLHQTVGLIVLGQALVKNGQRDLGIACLRSARDLAKSQSYFLRMNEADYELQKLKSF